jgi:flagellar hook-basal body complex protein FliE
MKIENSLPIQLLQNSESPMSMEQSGPSFTHFLTETNHQLLAADVALEQLASGQSNNLHQTMLTMEEAKLSFQLMEQIRNRLMSAYQDILKEQI